MPKERLSILLPPRSTKPRESGLTCVVDKGLGLASAEDMLKLVHPYVDIWKIGWAGAYIMTDLEERLELLRRYNVRPCFGGMMFEICYQYKCTSEYADWLKVLGVELVEVSNGSLHIPEPEKRQMIEYFANRGFVVLAEVGSKDITYTMAPDEWATCVHADRDAGAWKVILEGRADASAGIYRPDGALEEPIIEGVLNSGISSDDLIFEGPHKRQMAKFVSMIGSNVSLGNIPLEEVLNLECIRLGLRGDTVSQFHAD